MSDPDHHAMLEAYNDDYRERQDTILRLEHMLKIRTRQLETNQKFWLRAAEKALAGDDRELRLRVELAKAQPVDIVLSEARSTTDRSGG